MSGFGAAGAPPAPSIDGWKHLRTGKVRDLYTNESGELLIVASDRISAFDWVLPTLIPNKGAVLTQISLWWFEQLKHLVPNHIIGTDVPDSLDKRLQARPAHLERLALLKPKAAQAAPKPEVFTRASVTKDTTGPVILVSAPKLKAKASLNIIQPEPMSQTTVLCCCCNMACWQVRAALAMTS